MPTPRPAKAPAPSRLSASPVGKRASSSMATPTCLVWATFTLRRAATSPRPVAEPAGAAEAGETRVVKFPAEEWGAGEAPHGRVVAPLVPRPPGGPDGTSAPRT